jgi:UDP-GlcNAc:undecaprenyl-phosphate GlcNAc-1-phosphate transferase
VFLYILIFLVAFLATIIFTPFAKKIAPMWGAMDQPSARKVHLVPVPRTGGLAILGGMMAALVSVLFFRWLGIFHFSYQIFGMILAASAIIFLVGLVDDIRRISPVTKLIGQLLAASIVIIAGVSVEFISNPFNGLVYLSAFSFPLTLFWIVGLTNSINLIDGLDGLAAGVVGISSLALFGVALVKGQPEIAGLLLLSLAGVAFGFLVFNFNPASIFLGDSGSLLLGFLLAVSSVVGSLKSTLFVVFILPAVILAVPIFDTVFAVIRRAYFKQHIFQADDMHIHHRLLSAGLSHRAAVLTIYVCCILLSLVALILARIT